MGDRVINNATLAPRREASLVDISDRSPSPLMSRGRLYTLLLLLTLMQAGTARAAIPCDDMRDASTSGQAETALSCEDRQDQKKQVKRAVATLDNHYAIITHPGANNAWVALGFPDKEEASRFGLSICSNAMGPGCFVVTQSLNSSFSIGRGSIGKLYYAIGATVSDASGQLQAECHDAGDVCLELGHGSANPVMQGAEYDRHYARSTWPPLGYIKHAYASAARTIAPESGNGEGSGQDVWIATGYQDEAAARNAAVESCARDSGKPCLSDRTVASSYLFVYTVDGDDTRIGSSPSWEQVETAMLNICATESKCTMNAQFDPWNKRLFRYTANMASR